jgi:class 3 adenylate cyclase
MPVPSIRGGWCEVSEWPDGTVTLLFADVEGSTLLVGGLGEHYAAVLDGVRALLRRAVEEQGGAEVDCRADELFACFARATDGVAAAVAAQRSLAHAVWHDDAAVAVRIGVHTGEPTLVGDTYVGIDVNRAARICSAGHGGQIVVSDATRALVHGHGWRLHDLGSYALAGLTEPERIFEVQAAGLPSGFPPLRAEEGGRRRHQPLVGRRLRARPLTLEEAAWQIRRALPESAEQLREPLATLAASLFTASRACARSDGFIARIDRSRIERRLEAERRHGMSSDLAEVRAERLAAQLIVLEHLAATHGEVLASGDQALRRLAEPAEREDVVLLREQVSASTSRLDSAVDLAASELDRRCYRIVRTRNRGVYKLDNMYVVPYIDEVGAEQQREFERVEDARAFRHDVKLAHAAQRTYTSSIESGPPGI